MSGQGTCPNYHTCVNRAGDYLEEKGHDDFASALSEYRRLLEAHEGHDWCIPTIYGDGHDYATDTGYDDGLTEDEREAVTDVEVEWFNAAPRARKREVGS